MSTFKVRDRVRCLDNSGYYRNELTIGKVYEVQDLGGDCIYVQADKGGWNVGPYASRFELAQDNHYTVHDETNSSMCVGAYFTIQEATEWIQSFGITGHTYTVRESIERRKFEVVEMVQRELKAI